MTSIVELNGEDLSWIYPPNEITGERDEGFMIGKTTGIDEVVRGWAKYEGKAPVLTMFPAWMRFPGRHKLGRIGQNCQYDAESACKDCGRDE